MTVVSRARVPHRQIGPFTVLHHVEKRCLLNEEGTHVWNQIATPTALQDIRATDPSPQANGNVRLFLEALIANGLAFTDDGVPVRQLPSTGHSGNGSSIPLDECATPRNTYSREKTVADQIEDYYWDHLLIKKMHLELTYRCNFRCVHCYNPTHQGQNEMTTDQWFHALDDLAMMGCYLLTITGGELFVRQDVFDILEYAALKGFTFRINTNGSLLSERAIARLEPLRPFLQGVDISFYGSDEITSDSLTNKMGGHNNSLRAVRLLKEARFPLMTKFITMRGNFGGLESFSAQMKTLGVHHLVHTGSLIPKANRDRAPLTQLLTDDQYRSLLATPFVPTSANTQSCRPGHIRGAITPTGSVSPCEWLTDLSFGDLGANSLKDLWFSDAAQAFRKLFTTPSECEPCGLTGHCNRCPAHSYLETGDINRCAPIQLHNAEIKAAYTLQQQEARECPSL